MKKAAIFMAPILLTLLFLHFCTSSPNSLFKLFFFSYSTERNYMFLFCNIVILALVIKNSVLNPPSNTHLGNGRISLDRQQNVINKLKKMPESSHHSHGHGPHGHGEEEEEEEYEEVLEMENGFQEEEEEVLEMENGFQEEEEEVLEMENGFQEKDEEEEEEVLEMENGFEEEEEEDGNVDELNKKCEDFIRRMKQGIRIEAHQEMVLDQKRRIISYAFHSS